MGQQYDLSRYGVRIRRKALRTALAFEVWGGEQLRDMTYVDDVTDAFLRAAATPACHGHVYNIGGPPPASLLEIAELMRRVGGKQVEFITKEFPADRKTIDIGSYHADDAAFRAATGWAPHVSLEEGIRRSLEWYRPRLAAYL